MSSLKLVRPSTIAGSVTVHIGRPLFDATFTFAGLSTLDQNAINNVPIFCQSFPSLFLFAISLIVAIKLIEKIVQCSTDTCWISKIFIYSIDSTFWSRPEGKLSIDNILTWHNHHFYRRQFISQIQSRKNTSYTTVITECSHICRFICDVKEFKSGILSESPPSEVAELCIEC